MRLQFGSFVREECHTPGSGPRVEEILDLRQGHPRSLTELNEAGLDDQRAVVDPLTAGRTRWNENTGVLPMTQDMGGNAQFGGGVTDAA